MCHYITLVVGGVDPVELAGLMKRHGRVADVVANASLQRVLKPGELQFITTKSCDCGTALDIGRDTPSAAPPSTERLKKRGWSQAKIDRWLEGKAKAKANQQSQYAAGGDSIELWSAVVREIKDVPHASVGLFLHFYSGSIETEEFDARHLEHAANQPLEAVLAAIPEDTLVML